MLNDQKYNLGAAFAHSTAVFWMPEYGGIFVHHQSFDFAGAAANLAKSRILTQIGLAMLDQANFIVEYSLYYGKDSLIMEFIDRYQSIWQSPTTAPSTDTAKS